VWRVRFAGNEKGVAYQVEEALAQLSRAEVMLDDTQLWHAVAAASLWSERDEIGEIWQIGALDGRKVLRDNNENSRAATSLMQRVKQQLDPLNILPQINAD